MKTSKPSNEDEQTTADIEDAIEDSIEETVANELSIEEELLKMREAALRTAAEYDNYRKRVAKEKEETYKYANQRLLEELLPALDNFDMGMQAAKADQSSMIYIGMAMVQRQFEEFLTNQGVKEIPAEGLVFDHKVHEAVGRELVDPDKEEDRIVRVVRRGYMIKDRLLRPASVIVSHHESEEESEQG